MSPPRAAHPAAAAGGLDLPRRRSHLARYVTALLVTAAGVASLTSVASAASVPAQVAGSNRVEPASWNPPLSMRPSAAFTQYCFTAGHTSQCNAAAVADINLGLTSEHHHKLVLPTTLATFATWSPQTQLETIANLERSERGLPRMADNRALDGMAMAGAIKGADPTGPSGFAWGSVIAWGYATPLAADFAWMYDDGIGSPDVDCTARTPKLCWGHRDNILSPWGGKQGAAQHAGGGRLQLTELFAEDY